MELSLTNAAPLALAYLVLGVSELSAPFKGGVLVPSPDVIVPVLVDGAGQILLGFPWPAGIPSGATTWWQYWIVDATGPVGFAASNALAGTTP